MNIFSCIGAALALLLAVYLYDRIFKVYRMLFFYQRHGGVPLAPSYPFIGQLP